MMKKRKNGRLGMVTALSVCLAAGIGGCSVRDAVLDGLFGGVSDTVAALVSNALQAVTPLGDRAG